MPEPSIPPTDPPETPAESPGAVWPLAAVLGLAVLAEWVVASAPREGVLPGTFAVLGAAATGAVLGVRFLVLRIAGTRRSG